MNDFNRRYDFSRTRRHDTGTSRWQTVLILLAVLAITGAIIYLIIPHGSKSAEVSPPPKKAVSPAGGPSSAAPSPNPGGPETPTPGHDVRCGTLALAAAALSSVPTAGATSVGPSAPEETSAAEGPEVGDPLERSITVTVKAGDTLGAIALRYHSTVEGIRHFNGLKNDRIRTGQKLKVIPGPWRIRVIGSELALEQSRNGKWLLFKRFAADANGVAGTFAVVSRHFHPLWHDAQGRQFAYGEPENPYGEYLLRLAPRGDTARRRRKGSGIHAVADKSPARKSCGCIHVFNTRDIELLYYLVCPRTEVIVTSGATVGKPEK